MSGSSGRRKSEKVFGDGTAKLPDYAKQALRTQTGSRRKSAAAKEKKRQKPRLRHIWRLLCLAVLILLLLYIYFRT